MISAFNKDIVRSVSHSLGRFLAIAGIVALGSGFYAGLRMTSPDMKLAADEFYDGTNLMDIRVVCTLGLSDADVDALSGVEGVAAVMPAYETDVMATLNNEQYAMRVHSLAPAAQQSDTNDGKHALSDDQNYINRPILMDGSWPKNQGECVLSADRVMNTSAHLGDTITLTEATQNLDETLKTRNYTVVGFVRSSYYVSSSSMGSTSLGSGAIQQFMYVPLSDFNADKPYTEAFVNVSGAAEDFSGSDAYVKRVEGVSDKIRALAPAREKYRTDELRHDAQTLLDQKRSDYEREKVDAQAKLNKAENQLDQAAQSITENEQKLRDAQHQYDLGVSQLACERSRAYRQLDDSQQKLDQARDQVQQNTPTIKRAQHQLEAAWAQWQQQARVLAAQWKDWHANADCLYAAQAALEQRVNSLMAQIAALDHGDPHYEEKYEQLQAQLSDAKDNLNSFNNEHAYDFKSLVKAKRVLDAAQYKLDKAQEQLQTQQAVFDNQKAAFDAAASEVQRGADDLAAARQSVYGKLAAGQQKLDDARVSLVSGHAQLEDGKARYASGKEAYEKNKTEAEQQLLDAQNQLEVGQEKIDNVAKASWLLMDRRQNYGVANFNADADRVDNIALVFPFIFFLVAALVALTTMTRMIEEQRVLIGTYKALGYGQVRISSKYLIYAAVASIAGSAIGIGVLSQVLPAVISQAYAIVYNVARGPLPLNIPLAGLSAGLGVGITLLATLAAVFATLREHPSTLMLPRAPKAGKRILLERLTPVWKRFSFSWKVTFRNLFRYKKRFIMTIIGIAGCTALLLTGLGLQDAINDIINNQFGDIVHYNAALNTKDEMTYEETEKLHHLLDTSDAVSAYTQVQTSSMVAKQTDKKDLQVMVVTPQNPDDFERFMTLRTRQGHEPLKLGEQGVIVAEKVARQLGLKLGDTLHLSERDAIGNATNDQHDVVLSGIMENYLYNYVIVGPGCYAQMEGHAAAFSTYYANTTTNSDDRRLFNEQARAIDGVKTIIYNDETIDTYRTMLSSVNLIVVVLVVAAAALAFIVLYNLTNINITERQREIATLKVLGFTKREVCAYIYRETLLLSIIGCAVGLVFGTFLEDFVVVTAEVDQVMFGRVIHLPSYLCASVLTLAFAALVMLFMRRKLTRVNMVESLKSNE